MTLTSSSNCFPALATARDCLTASDSGSARSRQIDPDLTFKVGLIYGPSGCGKSSLVKAGLLPRLGKHVLPVYIEATPEETERGCSRACRERVLNYPDRSGLVDSLASLRRGRVLPPGRKVLLVLDQFEQWLSPGGVRTPNWSPRFVSAMANVSRRSSWCAMISGWRRPASCGTSRSAWSKGRTRPPLISSTSTMPERFWWHLAGHSADSPENASAQSRDQMDFLREVRERTGRGWQGDFRTPGAVRRNDEKQALELSTLREVGGTKGVGVTFLEETFSASTAPPEHRLHQQAAQAVLKTLLPDSGADIKGQMRSRQELLDASGYANRPSEFDELIHVLDQELRLITPTDPEGSQSNPALDSDALLSIEPRLSGPLTARLVKPRKQRETRRGRAELRLAGTRVVLERQVGKPEFTHFSEWAEIQVLTKRRAWTEPERRMMKQAGRVHGQRALGVALSVMSHHLGSDRGLRNIAGFGPGGVIQTARTSDVPSHHRAALDATAGGRSLD